jgi:hypothetical protein
MANKTYLDKRITWVKSLDLNKERETKFINQIIRQGWCGADTWSMDVKLSELMLPMFKHFKKVNNGFPCGLTPKKYNIILDKIIYSLDWTCRHYDDACLDKKPKESTARYFARLKKQKDRVADGLELMGKYWGDFWW